MNGIKVEPEFENLHTIKQENEEEDWYEDPVPGFSIPGTKGKWKLCCKPIEMLKIVIL